MNTRDEAHDAPDDDEVTVVLAAVDTSTLASSVVDQAARLARRTWPNSQLHILHVFRSTRFDRPSNAGVTREELVGEARSYLEYHLRSARRQCPAPVVGHFAEGDPVEEVLKVARSVSADLLLVGTHDATGLERLLLGSVAAKLARRAPCSVMIVRHKQRPYTKVAASADGNDA
jgi:nucleotide-binding universal stress UspA family protein